MTDLNCDAQQARTLVSDFVQVFGTLGWIISKQNRAAASCSFKSFVGGFQEVSLQQIVSPRAVCLFHKTFPSVVFLVDSERSLMFLYFLYLKFRC